MSFSYNNIINKSDGAQAEINDKRNKKILNDNSGKKKTSQDDIDQMMDKKVDKIFDVITISGVKYFLDKEMNHIWDEETNLVGIIKSKKELIFFSDEEKKNIEFEKEDIEFEKYKI